jgi:pyruvate dehydrogenase (quinone)
MMTNPYALAMPPKVEWEQVKGYSLSMTKLILGGRRDDVLDVVKSNYKHLIEVV